MPSNFTTTKHKSGQPHVSGLLPARSAKIPAPDGLAIAGVLRARAVMDIYPGWPARSDRSWGCRTADRVKTYFPKGVAADRRSGCWNTADCQVRRSG
jgi:hypothetical protein